MLPCSFSISGLFSSKGGEGGMSQNKGVLRSFYLQSNSSWLLLVSGALRLLYLQRNSSLALLLSLSLLLLKLLLLLLSLLLFSSSLLSILFLNLSSLS